MKHALVYSLKVWLTAATITPVLAYLIWYVFNIIFAGNQVVRYNTSASAFINTPPTTSAFRIANVSLDIFQATLYSIPYWLIIFVAAYNLNKQVISAGYKKTMLTIISLLLTVTPFTFLDVVDEETFHKLQSGILAFEAITIIGIWLYSLTPEKAKVEPVLS